MSAACAASAESRNEVKDPQRKIPCQACSGREAPNFESKTPLHPLILKYSHVAKEPNDMEELDDIAFISRN